MRKKISRHYLSFSLFFGLAIAFNMATYQIFLRDNGMSPLEMNLINSFFMVGIFLFEIPTGALADAFGRSKSVLLGCSLYALSFGAYAFSHGFWQFALAELIGALAFTLISGAGEAWLVESLKNLDAENDQAEIFRKEQLLSQLGRIGGALIGGYLGATDIRLPWIASAIGMTVVAILVYQWPENWIKKTSLNILNPLKENIRIGWNYGTKNRAILNIAAFSAFLSFVFQGINMYWSLILNDFGLNTDSFGWVFFGIAVMLGLGAYFTKLFPASWQEKRATLFLPQLFTALAIFISAISWRLAPALIFLLLHELTRGTYDPIKKHQLNQLIKGEQRATILSFESMISKAGAFLGLILSGIVAQTFSIRFSWIASSLVLAVGSIIFWYFSPRGAKR